ncbi:MAG: tetratricopeptide repeat protein, partial [Candidatus Obscuribacter sp.]|nr:tetratricopeptide repeat protein [Candidatus Obscuribacter sp.]
MYFKSQTLKSLPLASFALLTLSVMVLPAQAQDVSDAMKKAEASYARMNLKEAASQFREVIRLEPNNAKAHQRLGAVLAAQEDYETAILECKTAIK